LFGFVLAPPPPSPPPRRKKKQQKQERKKGRRRRRRTTTTSTCSTSTTRTPTTLSWPSTVDSAATLTHLLQRPTSATPHAPAGDFRRHGDGRGPARGRRGGRGRGRGGAAARRTVGRPRGGALLAAAGGGEIGRTRGLFAPGDLLTVFFSVRSEHCWQRSGRRCPTTSRASGSGERKMPSFRVTRP
jgi:hypothetical protein